MIDIDNVCLSPNWMTSRGPSGKKIKIIICVTPITITLRPLSNRKNFAIAFNFTSREIINGLPYAHHLHKVWSMPSLIVLYVMCMCVCVCTFNEIIVASSMLITSFINNTRSFAVRVQFINGKNIVIRLEDSTQNHCRGKGFLLYIFYF